jgi:hypothetical protein
MAAVVADTHAAVWYLAKSDRNKVPVRDRGNRPGRRRSLVSRDGKVRAAQIHTRSNAHSP